MLSQLKKMALLASMGLLSMSYINVVEAVTEDGHAVFLYPDGTWRQLEGDHGEETAMMHAAITGGPKVAMGTDSEYAVWYQSTAWNVPEVFSSKEYDMEFVHKSGLGYAYVLYAPEPISTEELRSLAVKNAQSMMADVEVVLADERSVNGAPMLVLRIEGTREGVPMVQQGYYFGGDKLTVQMVAYTTARMWEEFHGVISGLLDGFVLSPYLPYQEESITESDAPMEEHTAAEE